MTTGIFALWLTALIVSVGIYEISKENQPEQEPIRVEDEDTIWEHEK